MNTDNRYSIYEDQCLRLAETIFVKSEAAAYALNKHLVESYGSSAVNALYPSTWKYYLNLAGEYHSTDTVMSVVSMDTLEKITFSKNNLKVHRATARGYAYGTRGYKELVALYPEQEYLIRGILYPVDLDLAIAAKDGTILGYPADLVEENEYSLIAKLQVWIDGFRARHVNDQFSVSDGLYTASWMAVMYMSMPLAILTLRLEACHSNEAHSFHVSQYLASHGHLDVYMKQLTTKQAHWVYRNIKYLQNHTGKQENFEWLIEHIMTERQLPLAEFTMRHDVSRLQKQADEASEPVSAMRSMMMEISAEALADETPVEPTEKTKVLYPDIVFRKTPKNLGYNLTENEPLSLSRVLAKEDKFARSNARFREIMQPQILEGMENSLSNVVMTKFMESAMVDRSNNTPYTMSDILLNHWLSFSVKGIYRAYISVTSPKSGTRIPLQVKDAFIFYWYAFCRSFNIDIDVIPQILASRVVRTPAPSVDELMTMVSSKYISRKMANDVVSVQPIVRDIISTEAFYNTCIELFEAAQYQRRYIATQEHFKRRGMMLNMVSRIYSDDLCVLAPAGSDGYKEWFAERNIDIETWTQAELGLLWVNILKEATGLSLITTKSLKDLQSAMVRMLSQLSSYSIQINTDINATDVRMSDWGAIRLGDLNSKMKDEAFFDVTTDILDVQSKMKDYDYFDVTRATLRNIPQIRLHDKSRYDITAKVHRSRFGQTQRFNMLGAPVRMRALPRPVKNDLGITPVLGTDLYLLLPEEERYDFNDVYGNTYSMRAAVEIPVEDLPHLSSILPVTILNGLVYTYDGPPVQTDIKKSLRNTWLDGFDKQ